MNTPTVALPLTGTAYLRLPFRPGNRSIVATATGRKPKWDPARKRWVVKRIDVPRVIEAIVEEYGRVRFLWQTESSQQRCDIRCAEAKGFDCRCSCGGANHRGGVAGWIAVGSSALVQRDGEQWMIRTYNAEEAAA